LHNPKVLVTKNSTILNNLEKVVQEAQVAPRQDKVNVHPKKILLPNFINEQGTYFRKSV
jgi:hypothetical protein